MSGKILAQSSGIPPTILNPILEYMSSQDIISEVAPYQYKANNLTNVLISPTCIDGFLVLYVQARFIFKADYFSHDYILPAVAALNDFISRAPSSPETTPFQLGHHTNRGFYEALNDQPSDKKAAFHRFMDTQYSFAPIFLDVVDFDSEFCVATDPETVIFVDVGGGNGHMCDKLWKKYPGLEGRIILQDQPQVLASANAGDTIERLPYNFMTEQPIRGLVISPQLYSLTD